MSKTLEPPLDSPRAPAAAPKAQPVKPSAPTRHAAARRARYGLSTAVLLMAATALCGVAMWIGAEARARFDVTSTREHTLSPRTKRLLSTLDQPHEVIIVGDFAGLDRRARTKVEDVLGEFERATPFITVQPLDSVSPADRASYSALLDRLAGLHRPKIEAHANAVRSAIATVEGLAASLPALARAMSDLATSMPATDARRAPLTANAGVVDAFARDLAALATDSTAALEKPVAGSSFVDVDAVRAMVASPLARLSRELLNLREYSRTLTVALEVEAPERAKSASAIAQLAASARDEAARVADSLERLGNLELTFIVRTIEAGPAAVIVAPSGATAIRFDALFPATQTIDAAGAASAELRFAGEELLATAIGTLNNPNNPLIVLVHAQPQPLLDQVGEPASPEVGRSIGRLLARLRLRGMLVTEWPAAISASKPGLERLDPDGRRPVVWIVLGPGAFGAEAASRIDALAAAARRLVEDNANILACVEPSSLPAVGDEDPIAAALAPLGLKVDSGRPLVFRQNAPTGATVSPGSAFAPQNGEHPVAVAINGLTTLLPWPVSMAASDQASAGVWPLVEVAASGDIWGEAQWLQFRALSPAQRTLLSSQPTPEPAKDNVGGPWIIAAAAERLRAQFPAPQRAVVVGAHGWFFDEFTQASRMVDGLPDPLHPGNGELLEASIYWLAGMDDLIAAGPRSMRISRIEPLAPARLTALRWAIIVGLPALTLALGAALRYFRD